MSHGRDSVSQMLSKRVIRYYLSDPESDAYRPAPYVVQYAMEGLAM